MGVIFPIRLDNVNTTDLALAIREGCKPMQKMFDPQNDNLPYFGNLMSGGLRPENTHFTNYSVSHTPGRWLNALLNAQDALQVEIDEKAIETLADCTYKAFGPPFCLPKFLDLDTYDALPISDFHNLREGMHALYALVKYRQDDRALDIAKNFIATINAYYDPETDQWDEARFTEETGGTTTFTCNEYRTFPITFGRFIGPLVKLYKACGLDEALRLAIRLKDYAFHHVINENGDYDSKLFGGHTHSTTAMLSSLAQLGEVLNDRTIYKRIIAFINNGLRDISLDFGWCLENANREDHWGEINNTSDMMETFLILGKAGYAEYFQRAERVLRSHFLPAQLLDTRFIPDIDRPEEDFHHLMASRARGAFGFPCPYGHEYDENSLISFNWDIVGGGVGGLCEAYRDKVTKHDRLISVNLHFDHDDEDIRVQSPYTNHDVMVIRLKRKMTIRVRLSDWMDGNGLIVESEGNDKPLNCHSSGNWLYLYGLNEDDTVKIAFSMAKKTIAYPFRKDTFTIAWRGDAVEAMDNMGRRLCFFRDINE